MVPINLDEMVFSRRMIQNKAGTIQASSPTTFLTTTTSTIPDSSTVTECRTSAIPSFHIRRLGDGKEQGLAHGIPHSDTILSVTCVVGGLVLLWFSYRVIQALLLRCLKRKALVQRPIITHPQIRGRSYKRAPPASYGQSQDEKESFIRYPAPFHLAENRFTSVPITFKQTSAHRPDGAPKQVVNSYQMRCEGNETEQERFNALLRVEGNPFAGRSIKFVPDAASEKIYHDMHYNFLPRKLAEAKPVLLAHMQAPLAPSVQQFEPLRLRGGGGDPKSIYSPHHPADTISKVRGWLSRHATNTRHTVSPHYNTDITSQPKHVTTLTKNHISNLIARVQSKLLERRAEVIEKREEPNRVARDRNEALAQLEGRLVKVKNMAVEKK